MRYYKAVYFLLLLVVGNCAIGDASNEQYAMTAKPGALQSSIHNKISIASRASIVLKSLICRIREKCTTNYNSAGISIITGLGLGVRIGKLLVNVSKSLEDKSSVKQSGHNTTEQSPTHAIDTRDNHTHNTEQQQVSVTKKFVDDIEKTKEWKSVVPVSGDVVVKEEVSTATDQHIIYEHNECELPKDIELTVPLSVTQFQTIDTNPAVEEWKPVIPANGDVAAIQEEVFQQDNNVSEAKTDATPGVDTVLATQAPQKYTKDAFDVLIEKLISAGRKGVANKLIKRNNKTTLDFFCWFIPTIKKPEDLEVFKWLLDETDISIFLTKVKDKIYWLCTAREKDSSALLDYVISARKNLDALLPFYIDYFKTSPIIQKHFKKPPEEYIHDILQESAMYLIGDSDGDNGDVIDVFLRSGLNINAEIKRKTILDVKGTPLMWAAYCGKTNIVKAILNGKTVNKQQLDYHINTF